MFFGRGKGETCKSRNGRAIQSVLIVEDEPLVAFDNEHALEQAGYLIAATVDDYRQAIAVMESGSVDLVISDIKLRGAGTGLDVANRARELTLPVIFATATCPTGAQKLAIGCLAKPFSHKDLVAAIRTTDAVLRGTRRPKPPPGFSLFR